MTARLRRLVFAHDTWFLRGDDGRMWTDRGAIPWDRYLDIADEVVVVARQRALEPGAPTEGLVRADRERVSFVAFPNLATLTGRLVRRRAARHELRGLLSTADVLVARLPSEIGALASLAAEDVGRPWAVELVTCPWDALWNYGNWKGKVFAPLAWWETRRRLRRAPFALYVTESFLQRRYPPGGEAVGVSDVEIVPPGPEVLAARLASPAAGPVVFGTVGALLPFKGIDTAIEALAAVADRLPPFEYRVLGAGNPGPWQRLAAERGLGDRVRFDGTLPAGEPVRAWLDEVDVYVQPSRQEGLPRALVEAMSRGCPAVGSTAGGIPELLDADCLHRPGDAAGLGRLLVRAAGDAGWREAQARRNAEVAGRYAPEVLDERRRAFWASFAGGVGRRRSDPRVLFVTPYSQLGGSERQLLHLLDGLGEEAVAGVVALQDGPLLARLRHPVLLPTGPGLLDVARAARRLRPLVREARPDVVHAACAKGALVAGLAAVGLRTPVVFVKHDFYWDGPVAWVAAALCDQVVAGSEALNRTFPPLLRRRLHVVHPGVPPVAVDREAGRRRVAALTGGASRVVGMVARFHPDKGHLDAVAAVGHVPGAHLLLVGAVDTSTPGFRAEVERAPASSPAPVTFAGEQEDVVELLAGCDVAVVPTVVQEGFGLVVVEAFQAGTPVVAYGHGGLPEVVGDAGVLVPPQDAVALARAVASLLDDPTKRAELAARGRERAALFTTERLVAGMRERYRAATSRVSRAMASPHGPSA